MLSGQFLVVFNNTINSCFVFLSFRSPCAHLPHHNRTSTTYVSVKSIQSLHEVKTCSAHRLYDSLCSRVSVAEISLSLHLLI